MCAPDYHVRLSHDQNIVMFDTSLAGSLPKPSWLAEPGKLWPTWKLTGKALAEAKCDATLLWIKLQEDAGIDVVVDGEQSRQHFVHGFLESVQGLDFEHKVKMGIRNNRYEAMVPVVNAPVRLRGRVHHTEADVARSHTRRLLKMTMPGPMTMVDTVADSHYGDKAKLAMALAELLNQEARALEKQGIDVIQFDEPAFNVYMDDVKSWGIEALHRAIEGLKCRTAVHICYGYGIQANIDWKKTLGGQWRQYEEIFPALAKSRIDQVSVECIHSKVPMSLLKLLSDKEVLIGVIDVATDKVETAQDIVDVVAEAAKYVPKERIKLCTNCGMAPMDRNIAAAKLQALGAGARLARERLA
jgi:5-methyltetrahydropteroyltriglutamate--homocysteine methyltransferase